MSELLYKDECYSIQGAAFEVYNEMGNGFLEAVYQECLEKEFTDREIMFNAQPELQIQFKDKPLVKKYIPDFICYNKIIVEIKGVREISNEHIAQVINYLKATGLKLGLIINFGSYPKVQIKRVILQDELSH